jgi:hypothetical protein
MLRYPRARIYVSFAAVEGRSRGQAGFQQIEYVWLITVQSYSVKFPANSERLEAPVHLHVYQDIHEQTYRVDPNWRNGDCSSIRGTIMIAEAVDTSPEQVSTILHSRLQTLMPDSSSANASECELNRQLRQNLHILQDEGILEKFDVADFMAFALGYTSRRMRFDAAPMVAYDRMSGYGERRKSSQQSVMTLRSQATQNVYGGLM